MLYIMVSLLLLMGGLYAFITGSVNDLALPYDPDGKACGLNYPNYPYIYFPSPQYNSLWVTTCVSQCPTSNTATVNCQPNSVVKSCAPNNSVNNTKAFHVYSTYLCTYGCYCRSGICMHVDQPNCGSGNQCWHCDSLFARIFRIGDSGLDHFPAYAALRVSSESAHHSAYSSDSWVCHLCVLCACNCCFCWIRGLYGCALACWSEYFHLKEKSNSCLHYRLFELRSCNHNSAHILQLQVTNQGSSELYKPSQRLLQGQLLAAYHTLYPGTFSRTVHLFLDVPDFRLLLPASSLDSDTPFTISALQSDCICTNRSHSGDWASNLESFSVDPLWKFHRL